MPTSQMSKVVEQLRRAVLSQDGAGLTDSQLLECFILRREEAAFAALVHRHGPMVWAVCRRLLNHHDAEDAFQATFLVLVRKAAAVEPKEMLANWLYGVAHKTALQARRTAARRKAKERQVTEMPEPAAPEKLRCHDLQPVLDELLSRLPTRYRAVIVLSDLEGKTRKEVARQLGVPEGTVAGWLARARAMLAKWLARRGLVLSTGSLGVVAQNAGSACLPTPLLVSTIKAASLFAASPVATAGAISAEVADLTEGVLTAMIISKVKAAMVGLLVAVLFVTGTGVLMSQGSTAGSRDEKTQAIALEIQGENDAPPTPLLKPPPGQKVGAELIWETYQTNEALADETITGHLITLAVKMDRIKGLGNKPFLERRPEGGTHLVQKLIYALDAGRMRFEFTQDDRKELAKLKVGQELTIEGKVKGYLHSEDDKRGAGCIVIEKCKIISQRPPAQPTP